MLMSTGKVGISIRSLARRLGLPKLYFFVRRTLGVPEDHEAAVSKAIENNVRPHDVVWDVGANVGLYTEFFSEKVGSAGRVVAFEPVPASFAVLSQKMGKRQNVRCAGIALGAHNHSATMRVDPLDQSSPANALVEGSAAVAVSDTNLVSVEVRTGDSLVKEFGQPSVIKVDVEGWELEVLQGMRSVLKSGACRFLICEVHFSLLAKRGTPNAPREIENLLRDVGFPQIRWIDRSHLVAIRAGN